MCYFKPATGGRVGFACTWWPRPSTTGVIHGRGPPLLHTCCDCPSHKTLNHDVLGRYKDVFFLLRISGGQLFFFVRLVLCAC